jgi:cell wall-associated NlpC family hydrolase/LysM repeat protein
MSIRNKIKNLKGAADSLIDFTSDLKSGALNISKTKFIKIGVVVLAAVLILCVSLAITSSNMYGVSINGKIVGYVSSEAEYKKIVQEVKDELSKTGNPDDVIIDDEMVALSPEYVGADKQVDKIDSKKLKETLLKKNALKSSAYKIVVEGKEIASTATKEEAASVMDAIESRYAGPDDQWEGGFAEKVTIDDGKVDVDKILTTQAAIDYLLTGSTQENIYEVVDGDTIWDICVRFNIAPEEINLANPDLDIENIYIGDEIKLKSAQPFVHYETSGTVTYNEPVAFTTREEQTDELYEGENKIIQEGVVGEREVTKSEKRVNGNIIEAKELNVKTLKEPVERVVQVGTKKQVSSYSPVVSSPDYNGNFVGGAGVVADAYALLGVPYVWGGSSPSGFDCSGFVQYVYNMNGMSLPRTSMSQTSTGNIISVSQARAGDVLGWGSPGNGCYHVGIYVGGGLYIHAPQPGEVVSVASLNSWGGPSFAVRY